MKAIGLPVALGTLLLAAERSGQGGQPPACPSSLGLLHLLYHG
jgi:hypothetical protein